MFLKIPSISTEIDAAVTAAFNLYKDDIIALHEKQWKQEDIKGTSKVQYKIVQYYYALLLCILIYTEYQDGIESDWEYYKTKYKIDANRKKFACHGIDIDELLTIFGFPPVSIDPCVQGIGSMDINHCFVVEDQIEVVTPEVVDIAHILEIPNECLTLIEL